MQFFACLSNDWCHTHTKLRANKNLGNAAVDRKYRRVLITSNHVVNHLRTCALCSSIVKLCQTWTFFKNSTMSIFASIFVECCILWWRIVSPPTHQQMVCCYISNWYGKISHSSAHCRHEGRSRGSDRILIVIGNSNPPFTILSDREKR
jgi:hypothetical protein